MQRVTIIGRRFGRLKVTRFIGVDANHHTLWECKCRCGRRTTKTNAYLKKGREPHCGCITYSGKLNSSYRHGLAKTSEYNRFKEAQQRCTNPNHKNWKHYGGRGIKFLFADIRQLLAEIGPCPKGLELDRIRNNGNYEPGNVRWATRSQQMFNTRRTTCTPAH